MTEAPACRRHSLYHGARPRSTGLARAGLLGALSLEQLLEVTITGAFKYEQTQSKVTAAVSVISRPEIRAFGWRTLDMDLVERIEFPPGPGGAVYGQNAMFGVDVQLSVSGLHARGTAARRSSWCVRRPSMPC